MGNPRQARNRAALNPSRHTGMSAVGLIASIAGVVALVVLTLRLAPHYIDFRTLQAVMNGLPGAQIHEMDKRTVLETLQKRFKINNLRSFQVRDVVTIERGKTDTKILVDYEIRESLLGNADIVLVFSESYSYR
ncbi:MAG: DUF4845 domain-containing protein [Gammaproteobacteria bacterium]|nr:DUF4845 domain-containing protein [Gammaproteobacteria bacterium]